jgi:hypothetical protein
MPENDTPTDGKGMPNVPARNPKRTSGYRSAITARPEARLDGNSPVGRRVRDLFRALMERLGNPTDVIIVADVLALAELKAAAEVARVRLLEKGQNSNECVRLENLTRRAEARVGLELGAAAKKEPESLEQYLARTAIDTDDGEIDGDLIDGEETL